MTEPTAQEKEIIRRLVDEEGVPEDRARAIVTTRPLDIPLDGNGNPMVPLPPDS